MTNEPTTTDLDLTICDREPIHIPGSIQPHGLLLVLDEAGLVRQVAGPVEDRLGVAAPIGQSLSALIGADLATAFAQLPDEGGFVGQKRLPDGALLDVHAHRNAGVAVIELEPAGDADQSAAAMLSRLETMAHAFEQANSLGILCDRAAAAFRALTGFDRVMIYRFQDDDAGKVVAEDRDPALDGFINHHFPASDIPRQARALYLRNQVRVIPDAAYTPAPLRPAAPELDMSDCALRSVSPVHLQYLHNMGVRASASFSIVRDGVLWGLVACHSNAPHLMPYGTRVMGRALAGALSRQVKAKEEAENYRQRIRLGEAEGEIVRLLSREGSLDQALSNHRQEICRMLGGDGLAVIRGNQMVTGGMCPNDLEIRALANWVLGNRGEAVFASDNLEKSYPAAANFREIGSGLLALTLSADEPWLALWFRAEQIETVNWAGNPHKDVPANAAEALTPRASFAAWEDVVRGHSRRWTLPEIEAASKLRDALLDVRQNRRVLELNRRLTDILKDKDFLIQQKEFLIGEVNHRVQNSLQLVSSFLLLQGRTSESPELKSALEEARRRLTAVALVHRRLYRGDQIQMVNAARYVEELCADTMSSMGEEWAGHLSLDLSPVTVATDRAVTLGLVLTELIINIAKYAYGGAPGPIDIRLVEERSSVQLIVADRGVGKVGERQGFGTRMMDALVQQLGGVLRTANNNPGLRVMLTAPMTQAPETPPNPA